MGLAVTEVFALPWVVLSVRRQGPGTAAAANVSWSLIPSLMQGS